jgi:RNA polymerase sigma-70 factor, ECF subfamily
MASQRSAAVQMEHAGIQYLDGLYSYAMMLTRNRAEAEDLVQETYLRAIQAMDRLRDNSNLKSWLFTILRNVWLNQLRKRRVAPPAIDLDGERDLVEELPGRSKDSYEILSSHEEAERVRSAIHMLPTDFKEIILLREFEELSYQEIATVLGCPAGTVMSRLGRARGKLRVLLSNSPAQGRHPQERSTT